MENKMFIFKEQLSTLLRDYQKVRNDLYNIEQTIWEIGFENVPSKILGTLKDNTTKILEDTQKAIQSIVQAGNELRYQIHNLTNQTV